jgi:hypothetical protein
MRVASITASFLFALALSLTAAFGIAAAVDTNSTPSLMSRPDYLAGLRAIEADGRLALAACRERDASQRALCRAHARTDERIAAAELEARYRGTIAAYERVRQVEDRAAHAISAAQRLSTT